MVIMQISLIGIIRSELEKDYWGTLKKVAELGYKGIEGGFQPSAAVSVLDYKQKLSSLGLKTVAYGSNVDLLKNKFDEIVSTTKALDCKYVVTYYGPCESKEQILRDAETYNEIGKKLHNEGLQFCYHNHCQELAKFNGKYGLDILFENTDPRYLAAQIDVAWVKIGGEDPAKFLLKYKGRCPLIHLKDISKEIVTNVLNDPRLKGIWTEVGTGVVDFKSVLKAAEKAGVEWGSVEQDQLRDLPPMESIKVSIQNLKKLGAK
jgi:sugar phosphate isomerase/epimerase